MSDKKKRAFEGLWIPNHARNIPRSIIDELDREIYAHIFSFGEKGCYESNDTIGKKFMVSSRTVSRRITAIIKAGLLYVKCPKGYYRTLWAKAHPKVQEATKLWYRKREISKSEVNSGYVQSPSLRQNCPSDCDKVGVATATNKVFPLRQSCPATNTDTNKETYKKTNTADLPLPAGGQASRLLQDRKAGQQSQIEKFKRSFGKPVDTTLSSKQFDERKQKVLAGLRSSEQIKK